VAKVFEFGAAGLVGIGLLLLAGAAVRLIYNWFTGK
jgi:hypothetical protein